MVANQSEPVVANSVFAVVANDENDEDDDEQITLEPPSKAARIEVRKRKRKKGHVYILGWRWQVKENGQPLRTASGGYKRGFSYVKTVGTKREAERIRQANTGRAGHG